MADRTAHPARIGIRQVEVELPPLRWPQRVLEHHEHPGAVPVATRPDGAILFIRIWRHAVGVFMWEMPRGRGQHPDPVVTATNELTEETGYSPDGPGRFLGWGHPNASYIADRIGHIHLPVAADAVPGPADDEASQVSRLNRADIANLVVAGHLTCSMTLTGLTLLDTARDAS